MRRPTVRIQNRNPFFIIMLQIEIDDERRRKRGLSERVRMQREKRRRRECEAREREQVRMECLICVKYLHVSSDEIEKHHFSTAPSVVMRTWPNDDSNPLTTRERTPFEATERRSRRLARLDSRRSLDAT